MLRSLVGSEMCIRDSVRTASATAASECICGYGELPASSKESASASCCFSSDGAALVVRHAGCPRCWRDGPGRWGASVLSDSGDSLQRPQSKRLFTPAEDEEVVSELAIVAVEAAVEAWAARGSFRHPSSVYHQRDLQTALLGLVRGPPQTRNKNRVMHDSPIRIDALQCCFCSVF